MLGPAPHTPGRAHEGAGRRRTRVGLAVPLLVALVVGAIMAACDDASKPYVDIEGGGFIFNYRIAEAFYGVSLRPMRRLEPGTVLEVEFENPAGGKPYVVRETVDAARLSYMLRTPGLSGIEKDRPYRVEVRVLAPGDGRLLARYETTFKSDLDQSMLPSKPLTIGPGYTPNPELGVK
ncbi:MAG TPA: hypothetical protein VNK52_10905 [Hyphomicrobiaceae bacterium]|nr:hypothetical protein [Hyphomicrobiaceae bacterium]